MKEYEEPVVHVVHLESGDVICTSDDCGANGATNTTEWDG
jgi:hypothetical protein